MVSVIKGFFCLILIIYICTVIIAICRSTIHGRAEDGGRKPELREKFDVSVSRAVADLAASS